MIREIALRINTNSLSSLLPLAWGFATMTVAYWIFSYRTRLFKWPYLEYQVLQSVSADYLHRFVHSDNTKTEKLGTGQLLTIFTTGAKTWSGMYTISLYEAPRYLVTFIFSLFFIGVTNQYLGLAYAFCMFCIVIAVRFIDSGVIEKRKFRATIKIQWSRSITRIIMSKLEIAMSGKVNKDIAQANAHIDELISVNIPINAAIWKMFFLPEALVTSLRIFIYLAIGYEMLAGPNLLATLPLFALLAYLEGTMRMFVDWYKSIGAEFPDIEKLWTTFDDLAPKRQKANTTEFEYRTGGVAFESVAFSYDGSKMILEGLQLDIAGGSKIALVGPSGGGKTTVMKLIAGYMQSDSGSVKVDGQDIARIALPSYFRHVGYLTQDPMVFDGSIRDNLLYGTHGKNSEADILQALKNAQCDFVLDMLEGIDTEIGERGVRLSGGQKQRLAIAKIFLKNPEIILLDEPTAALDSFSEEAITRALETLFEGRTVFIIAHRLQTVRHADEILYIENGKVAERGDHETLVKKGGSYAQMLEIQTGF